ncbi:MAG: EamA family transporter, partial [Lentisphaeria bacterium]|nr:EamA family transporter [Lentisphaeria bacterium]
MALFAILLIVVSAVAHASWNLICKAKAPSVSFFWFLTVFTLIPGAPVFFARYMDAVAALSILFWILMLATGLAQTGYYIGLANAYRLGEVSIAYPLARSIPLLLTPLVTALFALGKMPGSVALCGMGIIFCGGIMLPHSKFADVFNWRKYLNASLLFALGAAVCITTYTVIDREGLRIMEQCSAAPANGLDAAFVFLYLENIAILLWLTPALLMSARERTVFKEYVISWKGWIYSLVGAFLCNGAYLLVLWAMQFVDNVSYIQAFRQLSIPLGAAAGIVLLHEKITKPKLAGLILIIIGLILVAK